MRFDFKRKSLDHFFAAGLWIVVFFTYLQTLAPSVGFIDSGELATVPYVLGIAHPTGYPLFTLLGRIFSILPFVTEEVVRLNLMSAVFTSAAAVVFYYVMLHLVRVTKAGASTFIQGGPLFGAFSIAFSQTFWDQSAHVEVYALHLLLIGLVTLFFVKALWFNGPENDQRQRLFLLFAFVLGLSFTNHMTTVLLAPGFLYAYFSMFRFSKKSFARIAVLAVPFLAGLSVYLYLPIRASEHPVLNWGNPTTIEKILWQLSAKQYQVWMFSSTGMMIKQLGYFFDQMPKEFYYFPLLWAAIGIWMLLMKNRRIFIFIFFLIVGCLFYSSNYDINDIDSYFLLAYIGLSLFICFGASEMFSWIKRSTGIWALSILLAGIVVAETAENFSEVDESKNYLVEDYTRNILSHLQPHALLITYQWDYLVACSYYLQYVKHYRTDVTVIDKELLRRSWYFDQMRYDHPDIFKKSESEISLFLEQLYKFEHNQPYDPAVIEMRYEQMINSFIDHNIDSMPVYIGPELEQNLAAGYTRVPDGFLYRLYRDTVYHPAEFPITVYRPFDKKDKWTEGLHQLMYTALIRRGEYEMKYGHEAIARDYAVRARELITQFVGHQ
jgi:Protein O-mannosyl-transferase TMEM260-like